MITAPTHHKQVTLKDILASALGHAQSLTIHTNLLPAQGGNGHCHGFSPKDAIDSCFIPYFPKLKSRTSPAVEGGSGYAVMREKIGRADTQMVGEP